MSGEPRPVRWASWLGQDHLILIFRTSHETMEAEAVLKAGRIKTRLTPQPREAREDCSSALALSSKDGDRAEELLHQNGLSPHKAGRLGKDGTWIPKK